MNTRSPHLERARLQSLQPALQLRSRILHALREWFSREGFIEVETPVRIPAPALELHIDAEPSGHRFLRTSPELHMKRMLCAGYGKIFQIGPCFRKGERGDRHNPEYTMLEWYRTGTDYLGIMADTESLLSHITTSLAPSPLPFHDSTIPPFNYLAIPPPWPRFTVAELFQRHAGWNPVAQYDAEQFEHDLVTKVEPALPRNQPLFVMDYPAEAAALSRRKPGNEAVAERFELYLNGVEIANAFSELTEGAEQRQRFEKCSRERLALGAPSYPLDEAFLAALELGMPPSGGIALGVDRLVMILAGATSLSDVMAFREI